MGRKSKSNARRLPTTSIGLHAQTLGFQTPVVDFVFRNRAKLRRRFPGTQFSRPKSWHLVVRLWCSARLWGLMENKILRSLPGNNFLVRRASAMDMGITRPFLDDRIPSTPITCPPLGRAKTGRGILHQQLPISGGRSVGFLLHHRG